MPNFFRSNVYTLLLTHLTTSVADSIPYNSNLLKYSGSWLDANHFGGACGYRGTGTTDVGVTFTFSGTSVQLEFLFDKKGSQVKFMVDGALVDEPSTLGDPTEIAFQACRSGSVSSGQLSDGQHSVTVLNDGSNHSNSSFNFFYLTGFTFTPSPVQSPSPVISPVAPPVVTPSSPPLPPQQSPAQSPPPLSSPPSPATSSTGSSTASQSTSSASLSHNQSQQSVLMSSNTPSETLPHPSGSANTSDPLIPPPSRESDTTASNKTPIVVGAAVGSILGTAIFLTIVSWWIRSRSRRGGQTEGLGYSQSSSNRNLLQPFTGGYEMSENTTNMSSPSLFPASKSALASYQSQSLREALPIENSSLNAVMPPAASHTSSSSSQSRTNVAHVYTAIMEDTPVQSPPAYVER